MKRISTLVVILLAAIIFDSCTKAYTCTCSISGPGTVDSVLILNYHGVSHNQASNNCNNEQANGNTTGYTFFCHL